MRGNYAAALVRIDVVVGVVIEDSWREESGSGIKRWSWRCCGVVVARARGRVWFRRMGPLVRVLVFGVALGAGLLTRSIIVIGRVLGGIVAMIIILI